MSSLQSSVQRGLLRPLRKLGLAVAARWPWPVRCRIRNGRFIYVDLRSAVGRGLFMRGEFDPAVFSPLARTLQSGDTFLDVGANVGFYSFLALDCVGPTGAVHAFEIDKRPLRCLRKSIKRERLNNLHLHATAIGERTGTTWLIRENDCGNSHISDDGLAAGQEVPMTTLDEWYKQRGQPPVRAIKMDIEGAELRALQGAERLIKERRPVLVCEAWDSEDSENSATAVFLRQLGYTTEAMRDVHSPVILALPNGS